MKTSDGLTKVPLVWVLQTSRAGDNAQAHALAEALGWPFELKSLLFNSLFKVSNAWLGGTLVSLRAPERSALQPPWPDLVIAVARRTVPVARWIQKQSDGRTRLVHLGRPRLNPMHFDLVISSPQYLVPDGPNVMQLPAPLHNPPTIDNLQTWAKRYEHLPRPWTVVLLGGEQWPFRFDHQAARLLAMQLNALNDGTGSSILCASPRTPPEIGPALEAELMCPSLFEAWQKGTANPYPALLQLANRFVVTGDSASMLAEACSRDVPVHIYDLPWRPLARSTAAAGRFLANLGILHPPRNMALLHQTLIRHKHAARLGETVDYEHTALEDALPRTVQRVKALFELSE